CGAGAAQRLRKALVAAGLPGGALSVLPGASRGCGPRLARQRPDGLWLCGGDAVPPILLLLALPALGSCCSFGFNPISSTFSAHLNNLSPWLLLDYPVAMPSNLEPDSACSDLWGLHFGALALRRMLGVAGRDLAPLLRTLLAQLHFVAECHIQDPQGCVRLERMNVSQLLETLVQHLGGLQGRPPHFPGCTRLRCRPGPALSRPAERQERHEGTLGARQGPPSPAGHGLLLLGGTWGGPGPAGGALGTVEETLCPGGDTGGHWGHCRGRRGHGGRCVCWGHWGHGGCWLSWEHWGALELVPLSAPSPHRDPRDWSRMRPEWPSGTWGQTRYWEGSCILGSLGILGMP
ncbi:fms-related tyrosine kinase 3 ligand, partial [Melospiza melodia melodia]|uniref:fms-related tyrosine kinase 3 ligand n=1 Tax=Melospiza melodia melodia TaxID=1914991 RepID=UPI002FD0517E